MGGINTNQPRIRAAPTAALALTPAPGGFTVAGFAAKARSMTGHTETAYTIRQAAYGLRKLRGNRLVDKPASASSGTDNILSLRKPQAPSRS